MGREADDNTKGRILKGAIAAFSQHGLSGARVDEIAIASDANKSMIYYYFGDKERLYVAALAESYHRFRDIERGLELTHLSPLDALAKLVEATFDFHAMHPDVIRMVMTENIHSGRYIKNMPELHTINRPAIEMLEELCARGSATGFFRPNVNPVDLHLTISALCFHNVSNQHTLGFIFERDFMAPPVHAGRRQVVVDVIVRYVASISALVDWAGESDRAVE